MAASAPTDEVKDIEHTNWLLVNLALYYMKSGVHTFIKREIDCLHQSLVQKIYGGQRVPLPRCTICHASRVKRDESGVWAFKKRCRSDCDAWLAELLVLHANPKSEEIYWHNSHVPSWPFLPWECAKVFMPRGQPPSNSGPAECDTQALLALLVNCRHFHTKISPQGLDLAKTICIIRYKVMHDGEMKVSDADKTSYIQQIIQLLEDPVSLVSLEDCKAAVGNIHKIQIDSMNAFLNVDIEIKALSAVVKDLSLELGMQEKRALDNVDALKVEYKQLRELVTKRSLDAWTKEVNEQKDVKSMMNATDSEVEQQEKKHQDMIASIASHEERLGMNVDSVQDLGTDLPESEIDKPIERGNNKNKKRKIAGKELSGIGTPGKLHRNVLNQCLPTLMNDLDFKPVCMYIQQKGLIDDVTMRDIQEERVTSDKTMRLLQRIQQGSWDIYEKFKECLVQAKQEDLKEILEKVEADFAIDEGKETHTKRRPESYVLTQLKSQTEDKLDTLGKLEFIHTTCTEKAKKLLEDKQSIVIKGNPGEGKTTMALHLIDNENYRNRRAVLYCPRHWEAVDTDWVDIVMLEDVFGQFDLDPSRLQEWMVYLPTIQEHVDAGKLQVIITSRNDILSKAYSKLASLKLFSDDLSLTLSSEALTNSEKMNILNRELRRRERKMKENDKEKCINNFSGLIGFPQCCSLFAVDNYLYDRGPDFFSSPKKFFVKNITELEPTRFLPLAFLFCNGKICEEYLSPDTMPETSKHLFMELSFRLSIGMADITLLRDAYYRFLDLYVVKWMSYDISLGRVVEKLCIQFTHATVCEAVGQVLGDRCLEMVVKYGDSEYLYQRTYTAVTKDSTSENVFLLVFVYGLLAERMVSDVVEKGLAGSVVKHSALKQGLFLKTLNGELHKSNQIMKFFTANPYPHHKGDPIMKSFMAISYSQSTKFDSNLSEGKCFTFLQCVLQNDGDVVKLVYNEFLELLECEHNGNYPSCWQCEEKQMLLELALYYHHFQIADRLITMNACYTHVSLCNTARHGDLNRVQTILETLKTSQDFNPECYEAKEALHRAYISGNQNLIDVLLKEEITLDSKHVVDVVRHGDMNTLKKVVEHLRYHDNWNTRLEPCRIYQNYFDSTYSGTQRLQLERHTELLHQIRFLHKYSKECVFAFTSKEDEAPISEALCLAYCNEKFDMADYLLENDVKVSEKMLASVSKSGSQQAVDRVIQNLTTAGIWDPHCQDASKALENAYCAQKFDVCNLLTRARVSLKMMNFADAIAGFQVSFESTKKIIQHLKDTNSWDPKCDHASLALANAYRQKKYDICDLLVKEGVSLTMVHIPHVLRRSMDCVKMAVKQLKETDSWDPKSDCASKALAYAYCAKKYDVCDLLIKEGVLLTMKHLHQITFMGSLESVSRTIKQLKDINNWDPKCVEVSKALRFAYRVHKYDVCDLLYKEGVLPTMEDICRVIVRSLDDVKKTMKKLKDAKLWDSKCDEASKALVDAYCAEKHDVCDLLIQEGVSLTMKGLCKVILKGSLESTKKAIQHLKDTGPWDPKCDAALEALQSAYVQQKYDVCELLVQEGFSLTMKNFLGVVQDFMESVESVMKVIQQLKSTNNWNPKCDEASEALANAYSQENYDVCDLLVQERVSLTMKSFPSVFGNLMVSWKTVKKAIEQLKGTESWDPMCDDASKALENAYEQQMYVVCDLLNQEGVSLTMKNLPDVILRSTDHVKKALKQLKDTNIWDPKCDDASNALARAYSAKKYNICNLLIQHGVSLTMKSLLIVICWGSLESARRSIQQLKETGFWDPKCDDASEALKEAYMNCKDVYDLLIKEGVIFTMRHFSAVIFRSLDDVKTVVKQLKDAERWDPKCDDANKALKKAYKYNKDDVCDLLVKEGVIFTMRHFPAVIFRTLDDVKTVVKQLKDAERWDPKCDDANKALKKAYKYNKDDVCDLLVKEGVIFTMRHFPAVIFRSLDDVKTVVKQLKDTQRWDSKCDDASEALAKAYSHSSHDVCEFLLQEGVKLTMKNLSQVLNVFFVSLETVKKAVQHLKDEKQWISSSDYAEKVLAKTKSQGRKDICNFLISEGVSYPKLDK
ncbi:hypothetical protein CHS0354_000874 [Potamilus streckersoni]|uniref:Novel STAND NTPase 3 domain-containing protein n=1 Tax=Potamilus streckersoni TaxID=2493646 RepID=A0AAE0VVL9_9BIVA|nr:hypothetical protein CHS0354_000874 [Potamilus streckersoni]